MKEIFLSASVPVRGRGGFDEASDPFLIQFAVRELVTVCLGRRRIVWGGHPSITPMVLAVCRDFGQEFNAPVVLYQSTYFEGQYPEDNQHFETVFVEKVNENLEDSLGALRNAMLSRPSLEAAVFVGGMEGVLEEHDMFQRLHGEGVKVLGLGAPGGAARILAERLATRGGEAERDLDRIDFARLFHERLGIAPDELRLFQDKESRSEDEEQG
ncbi:hypothetical protein ACTJIL_11730 [Luteimonas sp. 22616]|uniref:SLOG domain-containing protein n=1 Tax=Luteimonas sp. 22616 TaxID=3453951 RepID=UPI003F826C07